MLFRAVIVFLLLQSSMIFGQDSASFYSDWKVIRIDVDSNAMLNWTSVHDPRAKSITIQQFRWNKWVKVGEVEGKGDAPNEYEFRVTPHSGENKFRVGFPEYGVFSQEVTYRDLNQAASIWVINRVKDKLEFERVCKYEIYDAYGNSLLKGEADKVDVSKLKQGTYYVNYGNEMGKFLKK